MLTTPFGRTEYSVSTIGFGAWAIGASWGDVDDETGKQALPAALDSGVTFLDTADVYGDVHSERLIAAVLRKGRGEKLFVATKAGRRLANQTVDGYSKTNLTAWIERSLKNLVDCLDCPIELFFQEAVRKQVALIARVPIASGLLSEKLRTDTSFSDTDHRKFNRNGEAFDVGETFSGVPYDVGLAAVERERNLIGSGNTTMARFALRWILMFNAVTIAIPGARNADQAKSNTDAASLPHMSEQVMAELAAVYDQDIHPHVRQRW